MSAGRTMHMQVAVELLLGSLSNHRPPPEHDAIYATNFRVGTIESGLAMTKEGLQ